MLAVLQLPGSGNALVGLGEGSVESRSFDTIVMNHREQIFSMYETTMASSSISIQYIDSNNCSQLQLLVLLNSLFLANMKQIVFGIKVSLNSQFYRLAYNSSSEKLKYFMFTERRPRNSKVFLKSQTDIKKSPRYDQFTLNSKAISGIALLASNQRLFQRTLKLNF